MTTRETVQWVLTTVLFLTVILGGVVAVELSTVWLRNKREERAASVREAEKWIRGLYDKEREGWMAILEEKDRELKSMSEMLARLQKNYDIATRILGAADKKGEEE
jgi:hypothetical protein